MTRERTNRQPVVDLSPGPKRNLHFFEVHESLQENHLRATLEKRCDLFAKTVSPINATSRRFITADAKRSYAPGNIDIFAPRRFQGDFGRCPIDLSDASFQPKSFQPHGVRPKTMRFNHPR